MRCEPIVFRMEIMLHNAYTIEVLIVSNIFRLILSAVCKCGVVLQGHFALWQEFFILTEFFK
jgi:hypothetical protein